MVIDCLSAHSTDFDCFISLNKRRYYGIGDARSIQTLNFIVFDFDSSENLGRTRKRFLDFSESFISKWNLSTKNYFTVSSGFGFHFVLSIKIPVNQSTALHYWGLDETEAWNDQETRIDVLSDPARVIRVAGTLNQGRLVKLIDYPEFLVPFEIELKTSDKQKQTKEIKLQQIRGIDLNRINWRRSILSPCLSPVQLCKNRGSHQFRLCAGIELVRLFDNPKIAASLFRSFEDFDPEKTIYYLEDLARRNYFPPSCKKKRRAKKGFSIAQCSNCEAEDFWLSIDCLTCRNFSVNQTEVKCLALRQYGFCYRENLDD